MENNKICCIFNYAPHYRSAIYKKMDLELKCDFYFGNSVDTQIAKMDEKQLRGFKKNFERIVFTKWNYFWLKGSLKPILKPYQYYITSGGSKYLNLWLLLFLSKFTNKKVFAWAHGLKGNENRLEKVINKIYYSLFDKVLLYGERSRELMIGEGFSPEKLICIYNSLDYDKHLDLRKKNQNNNIFINHFKNDYPVIIYIGRIQKSKKLEDLILILDRLISDGIKCNLIFVGSDLGDNNVKSEVEKYNLGQYVWFFGSCYDEMKIAELIKNGNLCVSPGPIGLTALHAATYGIPIITNDDYKNQMPEFEIIRNGLNGEFFKNNDHEDLYRKVKKWITISNERKEEVKKLSQSIIDDKYNPYFQIRILKKILNITK